MRIGIDANVLLKERSGVGQYLHHLIESLALVDRDNHYHMICGGSSRAEAQRLTFSFEHLSRQEVRWPRWLLQLATGIGRWPLPAFDKVIGSADLFHWPNYLMLPHSASKHVITVFDLSVLLFPGYHPWARVRAFTEGIARSAARADAIIVISEHTKRDVVKYLGVPQGKIHVVLCAAAARFRPLPSMELDRVLSKYNLEAGKYLLCVGNVEPRKNLVRLVESYDLLRRSVGREHPMVIAGGQGWHNSPIYRKVEELGLRQAVRFLGYVPDDDLPPLLNGALLFVYPSLYEGFGLPPLEAMACGTPVVASNTSSLPEVVGDAALTVDPYDVEGLTKAMEQLLTDQELRNEMRTRGLARAKLFSWERTARETLKVYEEVYAKGRLG